MGVLEDAIREHLELKRRHGASDEEVERKEVEALGPARREFEAPAEDDTPPGGTEAVAEEEAAAPAEAEPLPEPEEPEEPEEESEIGAPEVTRLHESPPAQPTLSSQEPPDFAADFDEAEGEDGEQGEKGEKKPPQDWDFE